MALHLVKLYGTEQDRVNCPFYYKIGACTYGERCSRLHNKPTESQTVILMNMYHTPFIQYGPNSEALFDAKMAQEHLDDFYEDIFLEMAQWGEIEEIYICRNLGDHVNGNCYVKFYEEDGATKALEACCSRYYGGRPIVAELSPVTDFREARCRQYDVGECNRGGFCNFMHLAEPSRALHSKLYDWQRKVQRKQERRERHKNRGSRHSEHTKDREGKRDGNLNKGAEDGKAANSQNRELVDKKDKDKDRDRKRRRTHRERSRERSHDQDKEMELKLDESELKVEFTNEIQAAIQTLEKTYELPDDNCSHESKVVEPGVWIKDMPMEETN